MVLVNTLTVEAINTALIALQRGQSIVVGGEKPSTTVNNITISNGGGGSGGSGLDFTPQINALDKRVGLLEKAEEVLRLENERQNERLEALEGLGITDFYFDDTSRELTIELANGEVFDTEVTSESFSMEVVNGELIIRIGEQVHTVTLPMGSQADWTQTDPDDPSFIKHKIPIWITQGSADDNMSPIDSVTDGSMRPVTSNAVYDALQGGGGADIDVYPTMTDLEQDLPNLEDGQFVATEEGEASEPEWRDITDQVTVTQVSAGGSFSYYQKKFYMCRNLVKCTLGIVFNFDGSAGSNPLKLSISSPLFTTEELLSKVYVPSYYGQYIWTIGMNVYSGETNVITFRPNFNFISGQDACFTAMFPVRVN